MCYNAFMYESYLTLVSQLMFQKSAHVSVNGRQVWVDLRAKSYVLKSPLRRGNINLVLEANGTQLVTEGETVWIQRTVPGRFTYLDYRDVIKDFLDQIELYEPLSI